MSSFWSRITGANEIRKSRRAMEAMEEQRRKEDKIIAMASKNYEKHLGRANEKSVLLEKSKVLLDSKLKNINAEKMYKALGVVYDLKKRAGYFQPGDPLGEKKPQAISPRSSATLESEFNGVL